MVPNSTRKNQFQSDNHIVIILKIDNPLMICKVLELKLNCLRSIGRMVNLSNSGPGSTFLLPIPQQCIHV